MKKKLKLNDLKVQSFITAMDKSEKATLAGGDNSANPACLSAVPACQMSMAQICQPYGTCGAQPQGPQSTCPIFLTEDVECY
jgi:hypothetical protein